MLMTTSPTVVYRMAIITKAKRIKMCKKPPSLQQIYKYRN